jgi:hypothetical protein
MINDGGNRILCSVGALTPGDAGTHPTQKVILFMVIVLSTSCSCRGRLPSESRRAADIYIRATIVCILQLFVTKAITAQEDRCGGKHMWRKWKEPAKCCREASREEVVGQIKWDDNVTIDF